jgi:hypothetical protein
MPAGQLSARGQERTCRLGRRAAVRLLEYFELIPPEEFSEHDFSEGGVSCAGRSTGTSWWNARQLTFTVTTQGIGPC